MKREAHLQAPPGLSTERAIEREIATLGEWLTEQGLDLRDENAHQDAGSRDLLYWRYGYFSGLRHALSVLTGRDAVWR